MIRLATSYELRSTISGFPFFARPNFPQITSVRYVRLRHTLLIDYVQNTFNNSMPKSKDCCARVIEVIAGRSKARRIRPDPPRRIDLPYMVTTTVKSTETKKLKETTVYNQWSQQKGLPLIYAERGHVRGQLAYVT